MSPSVMTTNLISGYLKPLMEFSVVTDISPERPAVGSSGQNARRSYSLKSPARRLALVLDAREEDNAISVLLPSRQVLDQDLEAVLVGNLGVLSGPGCTSPSESCRGVSGRVLSRRSCGACLARIVFEENRRSASAFRQGYSPVPGDGHALPELGLHGLRFFFSCAGVPSLKSMRDQMLGFFSAVFRPPLPCFLS